MTRKVDPGLVAFEQVTRKGELRSPRWTDTRP